MKNKSNEVELEFKLPDFNREDIKVKITKNSAVIKAEKKQKNEEEKDGFFHQESSHRIFNYITSLPYVEHKKAKVDFKKGVLNIKVPKI